MKKYIKEQLNTVNVVNAPKDEISKLQIDLLKDKGQLVNLALGNNGQPISVNVGGKLYTAAIKTPRGNYIVYDGRVLTYSNGKYDFMRTSGGNIGTVKGMPDANLTDAYKAKLSKFGINNVLNIYSVLGQAKSKMQELINKGAIGNLFRDFNDLLNYYYPNDTNMRLTNKSEDAPFDMQIDTDVLQSKYTATGLERYGLSGNVYVPKTAEADIVQTNLSTESLKCQETLSNYFVNALQFQGTKQETLNKGQIDTSKNVIQKCYGLGAYDKVKFSGFTEENTPVEVRKRLSPYGFFNRRLNFNEIKKKLSQISNYSLDNIISDHYDINSNLKKIIRENLNELSESKKKSLVEEYKIINSRFNVISESGKPKTKKQEVKLVDDLITEIFYLKSQGFNETLINEQFLDIIKGLFGQIPGGILDTLKERIAQFILEKLGVGTDGYLANIVIATLGDIPVSDYVNGKIFRCDYLSNAIAKGVGEGIVRKIQKEKGMEGYMYDIIRNSLVEMFTDSSFGQKIEDMVSKLVCPGIDTIKNKMEIAGQTMKEKALS